MIVTSLVQRRNEKLQEQSPFGPVQMMVALCRQRGHHEPNDAGTKCQRCNTKLEER